MDKKRIITKSKYLNGLKCSKLLWVDCNDRERIPQPDISQQHLFDQGDVVGGIAKKLYPGGIDIPYERGGFFENIEETKKLLSSGKVLFEAGILAGDLYARVDILRPARNGNWDIVEVKSSTGMKDVYFHDIAFQRYCCEKSGLKINKCILLHIDNSYEKNGEIDPSGLLEDEDVTGQLDAYMVGIEARLEKMRECIAGDNCPEVGIGPYCKDPYICAMEVECWSKLPEDNIFTLYNCGPKRGFPLYESGIETIRDIPEKGLHIKQLIQKKCEEAGETHIDKEAIKAFLATIQYPVYFMDFETINPAVPLFDGSRPYQRIPFQFSVHVQRKPGGELEHHSFLSRDREDPRKRFLEELKEALGKEGTIMVFNRGFEEGVLSELADFFHDHAGWVRSVKSRVIDLLVPFRGFSYYNPVQHGSASIKKVLPAVVGKGYEDMGIAAGGDASALYFHVTYGNAEAGEVEQVYIDLEKYCALDTEGMAWILEELARLISET
jgi:hypothetical protein